MSGESNEVELSVRTRLDDIQKDFQNVHAKFQAVSEDIKNMGKKSGEAIEQQTTKTQKYFNNIRSMSGKVADKIKDDFKALLSLEAVGSGLKLSEQFKGTIKETVGLSDAIRKLGGVFGIPEQNFARFHAKITKGLGEIGMSSEVATNTLQGLADTQVRGEGNLMAYSQRSGMLASIGGQQGREGEIAKGMAEVLRARGKDPNDISAMASLAEDVRAARNATGKSPTEILAGMKQIFTNMADDFRKKVGPKGLANLAAASVVGGPNSTKFLEEYLSMSKIQRSALDAQGMKGVIGENGIDIDKFRKVSKDIMARVGGDTRMAAKTLGLSDEAADGFVRLAESLDQVKEAQDKVNNSSGSLREQYRESMTLGEAFKANINKIKGLLSEPLAHITGGLTDGLASSSESMGGSAAVVAGSGLLAAILAGTGLKGIGAILGKGAAGSIAKGAAIEGATGREVMPVYVTNASEIGAASSVGDIAGAAGGGKGGLLKKIGAGLLGAGKMAGGLALAGGAGYAAGHLINKYGPTFEGKTEEGYEGGAVERILFKLDKLLGGEASTQFMQNQKMVVELNTSQLKVNKSASRRGASY